MPGRTSAIVLSIALATATAVIAQTHFVVPNFDDLTIKTRRAHGVGSSTDLLYLKGARERREFLYDSPGHTGQRHVMLMQCDQRHSVQLNPDAKLIRGVGVTGLVGAGRARTSGARRAGG